ncbi:unnamed protein product [Spirodela intermedia]|uniref:Uncharacterized protein n=1 Tax=Spirodela intermedia TaxID=51605 RepID=A0A7I8J4G7_SPIIN|nr:unnamed protein product [Spirodela intermedia]CAA6664961.1 unnamed protein product [Spirodela intermedia]
MADPKKAAGSASAGLLPPPLQPLFKQRSWSPDTDREEAWQRRKGLYKNRRKEAAAAGGGGGGHRLSRSVTDEDLEELRGCIDLGFGFGLDSPASSTTASSSDDTDRLSDTPGAGSVLRRPAELSRLRDSPQQVKRRLKQWAQVVACSVRVHLP